MTPEIDEKAPLRQGEKAWAIVYLVTIFGVFAAMGVSFVAKSSVATYVAAALMVVHLVARAACKAYDPETSARRRAGARVKHTLVFLVLTAVFTCAAMYKGDDLLPALGRGALIGVVVMAALLLLDVFERVVASVFFNRR